VFKEIETGIDNLRGNGLIRRRIPMSTAPIVCQVCKKSKSPTSGMIAELIRPSLLEFIKKKQPDLDNKAFICFEDLGEFRKDYVKEVLEDEIGELTALDQEVVESLERHEILSSDISKQFERKLTFGERLSDQIAEFGGSWKFLISFGAAHLDRSERCHPRDTCIRSLSIHSA
jgi:stalled ribosome rescue protein Dom34